MDTFLKVCAGVLTALMLGLSLNKQSKDISVLLTLAVCAMIMLASAAFFQPIISFLHKLQALYDLDGDLLSVILKAVGIGLLSEICAMICKDAGNETFGKMLQLFSTVVVLWLSLPVFERLLNLLGTILGTV